MAKGDVGGVPKATKPHGLKPFACSRISLAGKFHGPITPTTPTGSRIKILFHPISALYRLLNRLYTATITALNRLYTASMPAMYRLDTATISALYRLYIGSIPHLCRRCIGCILHLCRRCIGSISALHRHRRHESRSCFSEDCPDKQAYRRRHRLVAPKSCQQPQPSSHRPQPRQSEADWAISHDRRAIGP